MEQLATSEGTSLASPPTKEKDNVMNRSLYAKLKSTIKTAMALLESALGQYCRIFQFQFYDLFVHLEQCRSDFEIELYAKLTSSVFNTRREFGLQQSDHESNAENFC